ncbi:MULTISPECIES: ParB/RepB/Spo0J family partition protein [Novosphingobium]|uniref:Putative plasmid stabilization protein n=1 Tax=Novosphingobium nitrogenifigens DSM 19370 TaxID=983920 RepID=F1ZCU7_9SPHN|nr:MULTISPECIES: ParB/RepB/Spo0J family partition protein [Novosphingobium]EGD57561.1 putative plasmid stabilization protein [Novosphingobium nitrogenifigens DSM 19370]MBF5091051.1 ParB/RepB/Spo0J family partition protein [Novosphingobium sp. NBM11]
MQSTTLTHAKLRLSENNVRKANGDAGLEALAASIAEHGLLQPLIVSPSAGKKTLYDVHAGGRRWRAIGRLIERGVLPKDYAIDVRLCENEDAVAREISLAENLIREAMTPADEARAYRDIVDSGADAEAVARRFGVTVRHVQGRLRLADLAEPIFAALADGDITLDVAMAYGSTGDRERQAAAWERLSTSWQADNPQAIRRAIAEESLSADHPIARFLGEAEYVACGGRIERDLFAAEGEGWWLDGDLAMDLAAKKLAYEAEVAELGSKLAWVKPTLATHVTYDETKDLHAYWPRRAEPSAEAQARMDEISDRMTEIAEILDAPDDGDDVEALEAEYNALDTEHDRLADTELLIPEEDKPNVGTFLVLGKDGQPRLLETYYTSAKPARRPSASGEPVGGDEIEGDELAPSASLPRSLEEQMAKDRRDVLALHIAHDPALALDLAIFSLARDHAGHFGHSDTGCTIRITDRNEPSGLTGIPAGPAVTELEQQRASLPNDWASEEDSFASFLAFRSLDDGVKAGWLAYAVSQSLKASLASGMHACTFQSRLGAEIGIDMAQHWRPGAENFFDRIKKAQILSILGQFDPEIALRYAAAKKSELATAAARLCSGDTIIEPEIKAKALAWVPDAMRFDGVAGDLIDSGIALDDGYEDAGDMPLDAANQNDVDDPLNQAA